MSINNEEENEFIFQLLNQTETNAMGKYSKLITKNLHPVNSTGYDKNGKQFLSFILLIFWSDYSTSNRPLSRCLLFFYAYVDCPPDLILEFKVFNFVFSVVHADEAWRADLHEHKRITNG